MIYFPFTFKYSYREFFLTMHCLHLCSYKELYNYNVQIIATQPAITCSKLTIETLEQGVKYVQC